LESIEGRAARVGNGGVGVALSGYGLNDLGGGKGNVGESYVGIASMSQNEKSRCASKNLEGDRGMSSEHPRSIIA